MVGGVTWSPLTIAPMWNSKDISLTFFPFFFLFSLIFGFLFFPSVNQCAPTRIPLFKWREWHRCMSHAVRVVIMAKNQLLVSFGNRNSMYIYSIFLLRNIDSNIMFIGRFRIMAYFDKKSKEKKTCYFTNSSRRDFVYICMLYIWIFDICNFNIGTTWVQKNGFWSIQIDVGDPNRLGPFKL